MDSKIKKIIEICRFEEDPSWSIMENLFNNVSFDNYQEILFKRDMLVDNLLNESNAREITSEKGLRDSISIEEGKKIVVEESLLILGGLHFPDQMVHIGKFPVHLGEGTSLSDVAIHTESYIGRGVKLEHSKFQSDNRCNFVGDNTVISNVSEIRGCFISGGPLRKEGRKQIYMHARSINNLIVGAYSGMSVGFDVFNHTLGDDASAVIDPETLKPYEFPREDQYRKLPVLIGVGAVVGACSLLNSGSIIGANTVVPNRSEVDGLVYLEEDKVKYIPARERKKL